MTSPHPEGVKPARSTAADTSVPRTPDHLFVLKDGDSFAVADTYGDIAGSGDGFFQDDTRLLSSFHLLLEGERPTLLSSDVSRDNVFFTAHLTNRPLPPLGGDSLPQGVVHIERRRLLWDGLLRERITLSNYSTTATRLQVELDYDADFSDTFEVRGERRPQRGEFLAPRVQAASVELSYRGWTASHGALGWLSRLSPPPSTSGAATSISSWVAGRISRCTWTSALLRLPPRVRSSGLRVRQPGGACVPASAAARGYGLRRGSSRPGWTARAPTSRC